MRNIVTIILVVLNLNAWEINTHRAIDKVAIGKSTNLKKFINSSKIKEPFDEDAIHYDGYGMTYIQYIHHGEKNGISQWGQKFDFKPEKKKASIQDLLEAGSILEDAQWPHGWIIEHIGLWDQADGRFNNHFADPQEGYRGLWIGKRMDALHWAWSAEKNQYDYIDSLIYFYKGFESPNFNDRRKFQAKMLVSLGHILHLCNDMNVPAHTRDDSHPYGDAFGGGMELKLIDSQINTGRQWIVDFIY